MPGVSPDVIPAVELQNHPLLNMLTPDILESLIATSIREIPSKNIDLQDWTYLQVMLQVLLDKTRPSLVRMVLA